jgi:nicotinic acid mononucleotide adenylyltransferase
VRTSEQRGLCGQHITSRADARSSYYKKAGLAPAIHRVRMCELAVEHTSTWLMVDPWEAGQPEYTRTAVVLEHFNEMLNVEGGGLTMSDGKRRRYKIMLLAGGDLIESFGEPGVWSEPDVSGTLSPICVAPQEGELTCSCISSWADSDASSSSGRDRTSGRSCFPTIYCTITGEHCASAL